MKTTNIDLIIPSYNDADKIGDAIASIQQQEDVLGYTINYNIIIIDDCSTKSNHYKQLKDYEAKYDNITILKTITNGRTCSGF
ncbi:MAG: glycosyltransferase involved in cell wall biosynthesis [Patiriisocius sp.]|jgi:glycosyltransferase involved in cell wall biosynthesis